MFYNTHIHTFDGYKDVPAKFLPLGLVRWLARREHELLNWIMHNLNPFTDNDVYDRYLNFVRTGKLGSQEAIFLDCLSQYPSDTKFVVLPMDMKYMGAGNVPREYMDQLLELKKLRDDHPDNIIPFVHIDPRRENYYELFVKAIEEWGFKGLKLYPPLGVFPFDPAFDPVYKYCQQHSIPVIAHCTSGNPVHWKGSHKQLVELLAKSILPIDWKQKDKDLCAYFTHPANYKLVFDKFPDLKICLAHFGRENEWDKVILEMMDRYPNLYVDISYAMSDEMHWPNLKVSLYTNPVLRSHCLLGSDFYMVNIECTEKQFDIKLRAFLDEELFNQIALINPGNFLLK
jgi:uncharacterized protein